MKTITLIDLLNKIANEEDLPKKIKYKNCIFENRFVIDYWCKKTKTSLDELILMQDLNDEVEIIEDTSKEESKIPEKLKLYAPYPECDDKRFDIVEAEINEIIDYLKSKGE